MTHDLILSTATAANIDAGSGAAEVEGTAVSLPPGDTPTAEPAVSRWSTKAPRSNTPHRKGATGRADISKADLVVKKLRLARGVTVPQIMEATGWQAHSVRGFLSAVVKKKLGLDLTSEAGKDGVRRYRVVEDSRNVGGTGEAG